MGELYGLRTTPQGYRIVKFDEDFNAIAIYEMKLWRGRVDCACFQANKSTCRHREMVTLFNQHNRADKGWFYRYDTGKWLSPLTKTRRRKHGTQRCT